MLEYIKIDESNAERVILKQKTPEYFLPLLKHSYHSVQNLNLILIKNIPKIRIYTMAIFGY